MVERGRGRFVALLALAAAACGDAATRQDPLTVSQSCMQCHNGSQNDDYAGPGMENPHPFPGADRILCTTCHGGNPNGDGLEESHVPAPPQIGDRDRWRFDAFAYFNRLTLTGLDKLPDYTVDGVRYSAVDYLQFINPGDLRVVTRGRSCGQCHDEHSESVSRSLLATEAGILSGAMYAIGVDNRLTDAQGDYNDTAADVGFRPVVDPDYADDPGDTGAVAELVEYPVFSARDDESSTAIHNNPLYNAAGLADDIEADGRVTTGSPLANLYHEQVAFTCGDCHLGSAGANNRYGDFRSSGCTACHMRYSLDGRSRSGDPNVDRYEPFDPDDIDEPELSHVERHLIRSVHKTLPSGEAVRGIDDYTCAGCHQGSNRTVMQYWGIRLDQNEDLRRRVQYPANPVDFVDTRDDTRLFDPVVGNRTFNGRDHDQYILFEDYDGDGRDDTPPDVHYDAGMGCIDCHGSAEVHGGLPQTGNDIRSRMGQAVHIKCESCHGSIEEYALTAQGPGYDGQTKELAMDAEGNPLRHVVKESDGSYYLYSRLTGMRHYVPQTRDVVEKNGKRNPLDGQPVYSPHGSYAMGRADGDAATGTGPLQDGGVTAGFSHTDNLSCASCHAAWTNNCIGCHLEGEYDLGNNFSNITGQRIVFEEAEAQFVYQSPIPFQLGVGPDGKITPFAANTDMFFRYEDLNDNRSDVFAFSDRNGKGNNRLVTAFPSLSHNSMMPHSIRGRQTSTNEGPRQCVACHLTDDSLTFFRTEYDAFRAALTSRSYGALNYPLLQQHIGLNTGNTLGSPIWVHMAAGLGTGLFLFDQNGAAVNPLDQNDDRYGCDGVAPADSFDPARVAFDLDRIVDETGLAQGSNNHQLESPGTSPDLRDGAADPQLAGPLGADLVRRLADPDTGIVLDSWINADGNRRGSADDHIED